MLNIYYVIGDAFTKYTCVKSLKDEKGKTIINAFIKMINESNRKPDKSWVAPGRKFYNINLCKNDWETIIFQWTPHIKKVSQ